MQSLRIYLLSIKAERISYNKIKIFLKHTLQVNVNNIIITLRLNVPRTRRKNEII